MDSKSLCGIKSIDNKLLEWTLFTIKKNPQIKILIKPHPILPLKNLIEIEQKLIDSQIFISNESVQKILNKAEILVSSGPTSIILESLINKCKLFYLLLDPCDLLTMKYIKVPKNNFKFIESKFMLLKEMSKANNSKRIYIKNNLRSFLYEKPNKKNIRILI